MCIWFSVVCMCVYVPLLRVYVCVYVCIEMGISKIARKLGIDSAPAVVGFEFHGGHSHPMYVCMCLC